MYKQPTVFGTAGQKSDFDPEEASSRRFTATAVPTCRSAKEPCREICEAAAGQQAVRQHHDAGRGFPAGADSGQRLEHGLGDQGHHSPRTPAKNLKAFNIGRKLALEPRAAAAQARARNLAPPGHQQGENPPQDPGCSAGHMADQFEKLVQGAMKSMRDLPEETEVRSSPCGHLRPAAVRERIAYAKQYLEIVRGVYKPRLGGEKVCRHARRSSGTWPR